MRYQIREPIWKDRSVGLAADKMDTDVLEVEILYEDKTGKRIYPYLYTIPKVIAQRYPVQTKKGTTLHLVPIAALQPRGEQLSTGRNG